MSSRIPSCYDSKTQAHVPSQGWKQILTARREMLDAYDTAREHARIHRVETSHGNVAEARFREWLAGFLPKQFGVTSGYIVSPGLGSDVRTPHFDVIVYDALRSPVLWIENSPDNSRIGMSMAMPVEHVLAVFEVKSSFATSTVRKSIEHISELSPLMEDVDNIGSRYKLYLPRDFIWGMIFFELRRTEETETAALEAIAKASNLRVFFGGMILRGEGHSLPNTGSIRLRQSANASTGIPGGGSLLTFGYTDSVMISEALHISTLLQWSESEFARFAFDLVAVLQGTYDPRYISSFYGLGSSGMVNPNYAEADGGQSKPSGG